MREFVSDVSDDEEDNDIEDAGYNISVNSSDDSEDEPVNRKKLGKRGRIEIEYEQELGAPHKTR